MNTLTKRQEAILRMFKPEVYSIKLCQDDAKDLTEAGLLEWVPSYFPGGRDFSITDAGRAALASK